MARILIIEDEVQIRALLKQILEKKGHEVLEASEGEAGLRLYQQRIPDLVITDMIMPGKEGMETILELKKMNREVKIIAISGGGCVSSTFYLEMARKMGAFLTVKKPFERMEILNAVDQLLQSGET